MVAWKMTEGGAWCGEGLKGVRRRWRAASHYSQNHVCIMSGGERRKSDDDGEEEGRRA